MVCCRGCENERAAAATAGPAVRKEPARCSSCQGHRTAWTAPHNSLLLPGFLLWLQSQPSKCWMGTEPKENKINWALLGDNMCNPQRQQLTGFCRADTAPALLQGYKYSRFWLFLQQLFSPTHTIWRDTRIFLECRKSWTRSSNSWFLFDHQNWDNSSLTNSELCNLGGNCTYRHVGACANKGVCHGIYQLPTDTKVTKLDFTSRVYQNVGWFNIWKKKKKKKNGWFRR